MRLRLTAAVLAIAAITLGVIATTAATHRRDATSSVSTSSEPQLMLAEGLYASLSDADATAAATFLKGGIEPSVLRSQYLRDLDAAGARLAALARNAKDSPETRAAAAKLAEQLPVYTGLVEAARANNRQGFPVGAAYLRRASRLMRTELLPAAEGLYVVEAQRMQGDYRDGTRNAGFIAAVVVAVVLFVLLVLAQLGLARFSNRILNIPLVIATVLLAGLGIWIVLGLSGQQNALSAAQRKGSDSVQLLSASRVLALRAQLDDSLALIGRGSDTTHLPDFDRTMLALRGKGAGGGLLGEAERAARRSDTAGSVSAVRASLARFERAHTLVASRETRSHYTSAVRKYLESELVEARRSDAALERETRAAQARFATNAGDANAAVRGMWIAIPLGALAIAALAVLGISYRVREYR